MTATGEDEETAPRQDRRPADDGDDLISARLLTAVVLTILALLVVVIVVGLARDNLDTTGVATVLSTLFSGIVVGVLLKGRGAPK